ncbi:MAG TPA: DUF1131 family protein [Gammaproteobacteria bacterium]|nr:DUF1131 family protein [Gammaproteobacteria bacterium]
MNISGKISWWKYTGGAFLAATALITAIASAESEPVPSSERIVITNQSIGGINAATPFTRDAIATALPGYEIVEGYVDPEARQHMIFKAQKGGKISLRIYPDAKKGRVMSVVVSDSAATPVIGTAFSRIYAKASAGSCRAGQGKMSGKVFCIAPAALNVIYVFTGKSGGQGGELPPDEVLADWKVSEIVWQPM